MLRVTAAAAHELKRLLSTERPGASGLRIGVQGGGCSGLSYSMTVEKQPNEHDYVFEIDGIRLFCNPKSHLYLNGLELDYSNEIIGGGFKFNKPQPVHQTCSCMRH
ncbi:iron-sulfur cluster assembly accessory protein [bacterium]|nr:iron-sulfur cluster assembly accessory protein [bacterium]